MNQTTKQKKIITVLGVGGHGPSAYIDFMTNPAYDDYDEIHLVIGADDSGGHTGILQKIIPLMKMTDNPDKFIPMGDLRANLARFQYRLKEHNHAEFYAKTLDGRHKFLSHENFADVIDALCELLGTDLRAKISSYINWYFTYIKDQNRDFNLQEFLDWFKEYFKENLSEVTLPENFDENFREIYNEANRKEFIESCRKFCGTFNLEVLEARFMQFCSLYFDTYSNEFESLAGHSIGNLFLNFLYASVDFNEKDFFELLREYGFIPPRVIPHFFYDERLTLTGYNAELGEEFKQEHVIDDATLPVAIKSYTLNKHVEDKLVPIGSPEAPIKEEIVDLIKRSDTVVLSTGSFANLFGQVNTLQDELKDYKGLIIWLGNIFTNENEVSFDIAMIYFFTILELRAVVLQMDEGTAREMREFDTLLNKYSAEGKQLVNIEILKRRIQHWFKAKNIPQFSNLLMPVLDAKEAKELAKKMNGKFGLYGLTADERASLTDALGFVGIKYDSGEISLFIFFLTELHIFLEKELGIEDHETRMAKLGSIISEIKFDFENREGMHNEVNRFRDILKLDLDAQEKENLLMLEIRRPGETGLPDELKVQ